MRYSDFFYICFLFFITSCSYAPSPKTELAQNDESILYTTSLIARYGEINGSFKDFYFSTLLSRLDPEILTTHYTVHIINSNEPLALLADNSSWIISKGLIQKLGSEGELAFVLAHELGHVRLSHFDTLHANGENAKSGYDLSLELEADKYALELITKAGYHPENGVRSLLNFYSYREEQLSRYSTTEKPSGISPRIVALKETIRRGGFPRTANIAQREFRKLQASL